MNMLQLLWMLCCIQMTHSTELEDDRKKWFHRIKKYELIHVNLDTFASSDIIEFDAFNNHYKIQLTVNEHAVPITLHPNEDGTITEQHPTDDELCYYHGKVLNADASRVALSLCEGEGIRGRIHAFGDKVFINPSNFYFAPYDDTQLNDEHLVYKSSDYDWEEETKEYADLEKAGATESIKSPTTVSSTRRRLYNAGQVELFSLIDETWVDYHGSVSSAKSFFQGVVSDASSLYTNNNLPSEIVISIKYSYAVFDKGPSCTSTSTCLNAGRSYMEKYDMDFDFGMYFIRHPTSSGGRAFTSQICTSRSYATTLTRQDRSVVAKHLAHELGHTLQAYRGSAYSHDSSPPWIMDKGGSGDTWSSLSISLLQEHYDKGKWFCLKSSGMSGKSVSGGDYEDKLNGYSNNDNYNNNDDYSGSGSGSSYSSASCIYLYNFKGNVEKLNGYWTKSGSVYKQDKNSYNVLAREQSGSSYYWRVNGDWMSGWCTRSDILDCSDEWVTSSGGGGGSLRSMSCANAYSHPLCFDDYENGMCFYSSDLTSSNARFELVEDEECFNDAPVWRFIDSDSDHMYYLHYNDYDEWVISDGEISNLGDFLCQKENLYECTDGNWLRDVEYDDETVTEVVDGVRIEGCGFAAETDENKSHIATVMIVVVIVLVIGLVVCGGFVFYRHQSKRKMKMVEIAEIDDESEEEVQEIAVTATIDT